MNRVINEFYLCCRNREKILIFSATGDRKADILLAPLKNLQFNHIYFVIPTAYKHTNKNNDNYSVIEQKELISRCHRNSEVWSQLQGSANGTKISVLGSVSDALINIKSSYRTINKPSVLVTGSLHLVGATLSIIDHNLST
jgi:folylpolyglutamate synthase